MSANRGDGVLVTSGGVAVMRGNLVDFNYRAGAFLDGGSSWLGPGNRLVNNEVGLWISADVRAATVVGNSIVDNLLQGVRLERGAVAAAIEGNAIRGNGKAAN